LLDRLEEPVFEERAGPSVTTGSEARAKHPKAVRSVREVET